MADLRVSELPPLAGRDLAATDLLPVADLSASETRRLTVKELVQNGVVLIDNGSLPGGKLLADSVTAVQIAPDAVTASELANASVDTNALMDLAVTNSKIAAGVDGAKLTGDTVTADKVSATSLDRGLDKTSGKIGHTNAIAASTRSGISYDAQGHITGAMALTGSDLPVATATTVGGISVPDSSLTVSAAGALTHSNAVIAGTQRGISYDARGHITSVAPLAPSDLPVATATTDGVVKVPGPALSVDGSGTLTHNISTVGPGSYPKVTVDSRGHVTAGQLLAASDIPNLDASKIVSGAFATSHIGARSITEPKLADYAIAYIQDTIPTSVGGSHHIGMLWLNPLAQQIRMWDGNVWVPIGVGALSEQNLRFCGLFDASTGKIAVVTKLGLDAGFKVGDTIPVTTEQLTGAYFVANTPGSGTAQTTGITYDNGDWIVSISVAQGWQRVDTLSGGGGGGATTLDGLVDVTAPSPATGQALIFNGVNWGSAPLPVATAAAKGIVELATQAEVTAGADTVRAVTPATLKGFVDAAIATGTAAATAPTGPVSGQMWVDTSKAPPVTNVWDGAKWVQVGATPADASETVKGIVELATVAEAEAGTDTVRAVTPAGLKSAIVKGSGGASGTAPTSPSIGQVWTDTSKTPPVMQIWDGTKWVQVGATPADASTTVKGIIQLATAAEVLAGTDTKKAVTPKEAKDHYLAKNIALLTALP